MKKQFTNPTPIKPEGKKIENYISSIFWCKRGSSIHNMKSRYFINLGITGTKQLDWENSNRLCGEITKLLNKYNKKLK